MKNIIQYLESHQLRHGFWLPWYPAFWSSCFIFLLSLNEQASVRLPILLFHNKVLDIKVWNLNENEILQNLTFYISLTPFNRTLQFISVIVQTILYILAESSLETEQYEARCKGVEFGWKRNPSNLTFFISLPMNIIYEYEV